jgi:geranylgeranylglycerol-phosphate geranylgeranyltransferase
MIFDHYEGTLLILLYHRAGFSFRPQKCRKIRPIFHKSQLSVNIYLKLKLYLLKIRLRLYLVMAGIVTQRRRQDIQHNTKARAQTYFLRSQLILFNSRKKHGLLYSVATAAGLFCIPGILNIIGSETDIQQLLIQRIIAAPFITLMITVGMFILNDLVDADLDKVNLKNRPISSGLVSKKQAWTFILLTNGAALGILISTLPIASAIFVMPMMLLGILYSTPKKIALMNRFVIKNIAIVLFYMLCTMLGITSCYGIELAINNPIVAIHAITMSGIMIFVGSTINDLGDIKGDEAAGRRTIPIVLGGENTVRVLIILLVSMPAISWMLYARFVEQHDSSISTILTPIAVTIVASLALLRMTNIRKMFEDMKLMREQHKKWFPLYMVLQLGMVVGPSLTL